MKILFSHFAASCINFQFSMGVSAVPSSQTSMFWCPTSADTPLARRTIISHEVDSICFPPHFHCQKNSRRWGIDAPNAPRLVAVLTSPTYSKPTYKLWAPKLVVAIEIVPLSDFKAAKRHTGSFAAIFYFEFPDTSNNNINQKEWTEILEPIKGCDIC